MDTTAGSGAGLGFRLPPCARPEACCSLQARMTHLDMSSSYILWVDAKELISSYFDGCEYVYTTYSITRFLDHCNFLKRREFPKIEAQNVDPE